MTRVTSPVPSTAPPCCAASPTSTFDVLVVGGGITGAGVALDAAIARPAHRARRARRLRLGHVVEVARSWSTAACATSSRARSASSTRRSPSASGCASNAPHLVQGAAVPDPGPRPGTASYPARSPGPSARAMWMYDLTGGAAHRQAATSASPPTRRSPTCRRCRADRLASAYLYYDAQADDARLAPHRRPHRGRRPRRRRRQRRRGRRRSPRTATAAVDGRRRSTPTASAFDDRAPRVVVNAAGVWADDVRAARRGHPPRLDPPGQGHPHHGAVGEGAQRHRRRRSRCRRTSARSFVVPWGDFTYIGTTDTDYDGPLDDPQCTPEDIAYLLRRPQRRRSPPSITERRHRRHVGRAAPARDATPAAAAPPTCPAATGCTRRPAASSPSPAASSRPTGEMAADTVDDVHGAARAGRAARRTKRARACVGRRRLRRARPTAPTPPPTSPAATAARPRDVQAPDRRATRRSASRSSPGLPYLRAEAVYAARHEMAAHARRRAVAAAPAPACFARDASAAAAAARRRAARPRPRLGRRRAATARSPAYRALVDARAHGGRPARDRARRAARRLTAASRTTRPRRDRADPADRARRHRRSRSADAAPSRRRRCVARARRRVRRRSPPTPTQRAEASRDWWPLAMTWALDGEVAGAGRGRRAARPTADEVAAVLRICNEAGMPGHRGRRAQRRVRRVACPLLRRRRARPHAA